MGVCVLVAFSFVSHVPTFSWAHTTTHCLLASRMATADPKYLLVETKKRIWFVIAFIVSRWSTDCSSSPSLRSISSHPQLQPLRRCRCWRTPPLLFPSPSPIVDAVDGAESSLPRWSALHLLSSLALAPPSTPSPVENRACLDGTTFVPWNHEPCLPLARFGTK